MTELSPGRSAHLRPLPAYEPVARRAPEPCPGQLVLPLRSATATPRIPDVGLPPAPPPPPPHALRSIITGLVEVTAGHRPLEPLRTKLSEPLFHRLLRPPGLRLGRGPVIREVHVDSAHTGVLHLCATVHEPAHERAFAVVARLDARWHGWQITEFQVIRPTRARRDSTRPADIREAG